MLRNYSNKSVYVGIDVHKKTYFICCITEGKLVKKASCPANPREFAHSLKKWFAGAKIYSVYEAGFSGFVLHRVLQSVGISNMVVNPASIPIASNDRVKTDKRDAMKLATELSLGNFEKRGNVRVPSVKEQSRRQITRVREQIVRTRTQVSNRIKSKLQEFGLMSRDDEAKITHKKIKSIEQYDFPEELGFALSMLFQQWRLLTTQLSEIRKKLKMQSQQDQKIGEIYRSLPGVGPVSERILANELGDLKQFKNIRAAYSYTGLTPREHSSGERQRKGHISRQGSDRIRHVLVEVAWRAIGKDPRLKSKFETIAAKRGKKIAIVAIARNIIGRLRACHIEGQKYQICH